MTPEQFIQKVRDAGVLPAPIKPTYGELLSEHVVAGVDHVVSPDTGECWIHPPLLRLFDAARDLLGSAIRISAGSRTPAHERALAAKGYKTAKFISPHCLSALDCEAVSTSNLALQNALRQAAKNLTLPEPRLGHVTYDERFTHVDMVFLLFAPYTRLPHPRDWPELQASERMLISGSWQRATQW